MSFRTTPRGRRRLAAVLAAGSIILSACSAGADDDRPGELGPGAVTEGAGAPEPATDTEEAGDAPAAAPVKAKPLRPGETRRTIAMPASYTPSAPYGKGTDDYRCFLLDPGLDRDAWLTGTHVLPGNPDVVHHVILFHAPPEQVQDVPARAVAARPAPRLRGPAGPLRGVG